jgi:hypothetical protein
MYFGGVQDRKPFSHRHWRITPHGFRSSFRDWAAETWQQREHQACCASISREEQISRVSLNHLNKTLRLNQRPQRPRIETPDEYERCCGDQLNSPPKAVIGGQASRAGSNLFVDLINARLPLDEDFTIATRPEQSHMTTVDSCSIEGP